MIRRNYTYGNTSEEKIIVSTELRHHKHSSSFSDLKSRGFIRTSYNEVFHIWYTYGI